MELAVRLTGAGTTGASTSGGLVVGLVCSLALLALGLAHYRGAVRWLAHWGIPSQYTVLALAWLGAGGVLATITSPGVHVLAYDVWPPRTAARVAGWCSRPPTDRCRCA